MALKREHKILIGVGSVLLIATTIGIVMYRKKDDTETIVDDNTGRKPLDESANEGEVVGQYANVPIVRRPIVQGNMTAVPTTSNPSSTFGHPVSHPVIAPTIQTSDGTQWREFSKNESIVSKPDGSYVFMFKTKQNLGSLKKGDQIFINGTDNIFDGFKQIDDVFIEGNKIGGVYIKLNPSSPTAANSIRIKLRNPQVFSNRAIAQKKF